MVYTALQDHQTAAVEVALRYKRFIICMDAGSGKTLTALSLWEKARSPSGHCVVLCPKSAAVSWAAEVKKHTSLSICCDGTIDSTCDISVLTYPQMKSQIQALLKVTREQHTTLIIDEAHVLRSGDSQQAKLLRLLIPKFTLVYALTATPLGNHIEDTYFLYESLFPGIFGSLSKFLERYTVREKRTIRRKNRLIEFWEIVSHKNLDELAERIRPTMYRYTIDYKIHFEFQEAAPLDTEWAVYRQAAAGVLGAGDQVRDFVARLPQLQQVVNGFAAKQALAQELVQQIHARGEAVIVFTCFLESFDALADLVEQSVALGPDNRIWRLSGQTSISLRKDIVANFKPGDILVSTTAGCQSLNLQAANNIVCFDLPWGVQQFVQLCGRIARMDSKHPIKTVNVVGAAGTIDEYKRIMMQSNLDLIKQVIGGNVTYNSLAKEAKKKTLKALRKHLLWAAGKS